jgi:hypothetical protein
MGCGEGVQPRAYRTIKRSACRISEANLGGIVPEYSDIGAIALQAENSSSRWTVAERQSTAFGPLRKRALSNRVL